MRSEVIFNERGQVQSRAFVAEDGTAAFVCPNCEMSRNVPVFSFRGNKHSINIRCRCQETFTIDLDFRKSHRKPTKLSGFYEITSGGGGRAVISDISREGLGFMVSGVHNVRVGQKILVNFALDDKHNTPLKKTAVVRSVDQNRIGCEFKRDQAFEKSLGFYLRT
ncbi:MAG: PilZ domain-containing protein [Desulfofustis sp.]|nr:PilZ domain-containing protein [Desulfofustis sp.]